MTAPINCILAKKYKLNVTNFKKLFSRYLFAVFKTHFLILPVLAALYAPAAGAVFATPAEFKVDEAGAARYTLPIAVPPGTAGMQPSLALNYNSHSTNGLLGMGWSLSGLSAVHRCPATIAQDGFSGTINFDANDRFCIDGQRLIAVIGAYGANSTEYRTERESYTRVISYGSVGSGPAYFKAWTKSGQILEYGITPDSAIEAQGSTSIRLWAVNKVEDRVGNYLTISYQEDNLNGEYYPVQINYSGHTTQNILPYNSVKFVYAFRPDTTAQYQGGTLVQNRVRLTNIQAYMGITLVRDYQLTYDNSGLAGGSRLSALQECAPGAVGTSCLPATTFAWLTNPTPTRTAFSTWGGGHGTDESVGDFNGDGKSDLVRTTTGDAWVSLSSGAGFTAPAVWGSGLGTSGTEIHVTDVNADGKSDIVRFAPDGSATAWISNGAGFTGPVSRGSGFGTDPSRVRLAELNGDGYEDAILFHTDENFYVFLGGANGYVASTVPWGAGHGTDMSALQIADFNGDNKGDVIRFLADGRSLVWLSRGDKFFEFTEWGNSHGGTFSALKLADFNGDGNKDVIQLAGDTAYVWLSTGTRFATAASWGTGHTVNDTVYDINGDGRADVIRPASDGHYVRLSTGQIFTGWGRWGDNPSVTTAVKRIDTRTVTFYGHYLSTYDDFRYGPAYACQQFGYSDSTGAYECGCSPDSCTVTVDYRHNGEWGSSSNITAGNVWCGGRQYVAWMDCTYPDPGANRLGDFNGDGLIDLANLANDGTVTVSLAAGGVSDLLATITNGLGATISLTHAPLTNTSIYVKDGNAIYPYQDVQAPLYVIAAVSSSDGLGAARTVNYSYTGAKAHLNGRGFLGFRVIVATDAQSGVRTRTFYYTRHPYIGLIAILQQVTSTGRLTKRVDTTWSNQPYAPGSLVKFPFVLQSVDKTYDLKSAASDPPLSTVTTDNQYDTYGNPTSIKTTTTELANTIGWIKTVTNTYTNDGTQWILGRLTRAQVTSQLPNGQSATRTSSFAYDLNGLLKQETIEPSSLTLKLVTDYGYDAFGNKVTATTSGPNIVARSTTTA